MKLRRFRTGLLPIEIVPKLPLLGFTDAHPRRGTANDERRGFEHTHTRTAPRPIDRI